MFNSQVPYSYRASRQREQRRQRKEASLNILNHIDSYTISSDDDSIPDAEDECAIDVQQDAMCAQDDEASINYSKSNTLTYTPDDNDTYWNEDLVNLSLDLSLPLYHNSHTSVKTAATTIMSMACEFNLPKYVLERILKVFKSLLPSPNLLPTTHNSIIKTIGVLPTSSTKFYCNSCYELCTIRAGRKFCENAQCILVNQLLRTRNISEVVTLNITDQLKSILSRNLDLFNNTELFPSSDIRNGTFYEKSIALASDSNKSSHTTVHPITLNIHTDGAPLVRTTKMSLWPCFASVVELPPQIREKQTNILVLCLWSSSSKPNVDLFMKDCIRQLLDLSISTIITVNDVQFSITVKTQLFLSDLPAKALFWKTISYNGYSACTNCLTEGVCRNRQVFYPYNKNSYQQRNHAEFLAIAEAAENRATSTKKGSTVKGIKGISPLLQIFEYPKQIILDYMHLCCLGHMSTLIHRWLPMLNNEALNKINSKLLSQRFPHNMSVKFNYPLNLCSDWKAKHFRVFVLSVGLPYMLPHLPQLIASHFALYSMFIKLLHCPKSNDEIELADKIIHYYCQTAPKIYGEACEIFSLHAHLHLPQQVLTHGGLSFTSAFCFESAIRYLKKKAHGTRNLATQIADWINAETIVTRPPFQLSAPTGINSIGMNDPVFDTYRQEFLNLFHTFVRNNNEINLFLRYKDAFITYHTVLYDLPFSCSSYIISYKSLNCSIQYGQVIVFIKHHKDYYAFIREYKPTEKNTSDYVLIPDELNVKLNEIFAVRRLSKSYALIPVINICHKCIQVEYDDHVFLSEIRVDYEHD